MTTLESLDARLEEIGRSLADLRRRLETVEEVIETRQVAAPTVLGEPDPGAFERPAPPVESTDGDQRSTLTEGLAYAGRTLLVLGGAYLLRALTESGAIPAALGIFLGLVYGSAWIALAWRAAGRGRQSSAVAHGLAASAVGLPLVWETTVRFELLSPSLGAVLLFAYLVGLYGVAWHRNLRALAWIVGVGGFTTALATMFGSATLPPFIGVLVLLGGGVLLSEPARGWGVLSWVTAAAADMGVLVLSLLAGIERSGVDPGAAVWSQLLLPVVYLGLFGVFVVRGRRPLDPFAVVQSAAATVLGLGGAMVSLQRLPGLAMPLGAAVLVAALLVYRIAFRVVDRTRRRPFHYFGTLGTGLALFATELLLAQPELVWAILVPLAAAAAWRLGRLSLVLHAALFALAATWSSGLVTEGVLAFAAPAHGSWGEPRPEALLTLGAILVALAFPTPASPYRGGFRDAARLVLVTIAVWGLGSLAIRLGARGLHLEPAAGTDPGALAALRTVILAVAAIALSWASRLDRFRSARWLVYPLLVIGAFKIVLEDFMAGRPATLVVSLLAYGTALIVAPRLMARRRP